MTTYHIPQDFPTLQAAFEALGSFPDQTVVNISSGHALTAGLRLDGGDYTRVRITADDAIVMLASSFDMAEIVFYGDRCRMPVLECLIDADGRGRHGIFIDSGSFMEIAPGAGINHPGVFGLYANRGSVAICNGANFREAGANGTSEAQAGGTGISARRGSIVHADEADVRGSLMYGISASQASMVSFNAGIAAGCGRHNIRAEEGSILTCKNASARDAGAFGCYAWQGAVINAQGADVAKNSAGSTQRGFYAAEGSTINAEGGNALYVTQSGFTVADGSTINASGGQGSLSKAANSINAAGVIYR